MADKCKVCGYVFQGPQTDSVACLASIERSTRMIQNLLLAWFLVTLAGALLWLAASALR
jgi:uncharacterized membrane protein